MFVVPSFEIHGGVKGLFDLGPPACGLKANMIDVWRKHFVLEENMLEVLLQSLICVIVHNNNNDSKIITLTDGMHEFDTTLCIENEWSC